MRKMRASHLAKALVVAIALVSQPGCVSAGEISVSGVLTDRNGKPLDRAFVYVDAAPRVASYTRNDGAFKLQGEMEGTAARLIASAPGMEQKRIRLSDLPATGARIVLDEEPGEYTRIEVGAALTVTMANVVCRHTVPHLLSAEERECYEAYQQFLHENGNTFIEEMLKNETDNAAVGGRYHYILIAEIFGRAYIYEAANQRFPRNIGFYKDRGIQVPDMFWINGTRCPCDARRCRAFADRLLEKSRDAMKKGYVGQPLSEEDIRFLRYHIIYDGMRGHMLQRPCDGKFAYDPTVRWKKPISALGDSVPHMRFKRLEAVFRSPYYSDYPSLTLTEFLRPEGLAQYFCWILPYYVREKGEDGRIHTAPDPKKLAAIGPGHKPEDYIDIEELCKEKPVVLFNWNPGDRAAWAKSDLNEYAYLAYKDRVDFFLVETPQTYYGDDYTDEFEFYGPNPDAYPLRGLACRQGELWIDQEQRARRARMDCMERLTMSIPIVVDNNGRTFSSIARGQNAPIGGAGHVAWGLIDRDGRLAAAKGPIGWQPFHINQYYIPYTRISYLEREIRALLQNGGRFDKDRPATILRPKPTPERGFLFNTPFEVIGVEGAKNLIHATYKGRDYTFRLPHGTRVMVERNGRTAITNHTALSRGNTVFADILLREPVPWRETRLWHDRFDAFQEVKPFDVEAYADKETEVVRLHCRGPSFDYGKIRFFTTFYGRIISKNGNKITVECSKDYFLNLPGYRYWQEDKDKADITAYVTGRSTIPQRRMNILNRMLAEPGDALRRTFTVDRAVRVMKNGYLADMDTQMDALAAGDFAGVEYEYFFEEQNEPVIYPEWVWANGTLGEN